MMGTEIFKIDASWAEKLTKTRVSFLTAPTVDMKSNYKQGKSDIACRLCQSSEETQLHLLHCEALKDSSLLTQDTPQYCDLMGQDHARIEAIGRILKTKFTQFKLKTQTNQCTGQDAMCST